MNWHFFPYALQYVIGGCFSIVISGYILYRNAKTMEIVSFFLCGLFTSTWMFFIFLHRIAPTGELSGVFFRIAMFFPQIYVAFLLVTVMSINKPRKIYFLYLIPAFAVEIMELITPIDISWGRWGWSYKFVSSFMRLYTVSTAEYFTAVCVALIVLMRKYQLSITVKKYKIILVAFTVYIVGMVSTNYMIAANSDFPTCGGFLTIVFFSLIAYTTNLPTEKITLSSLTHNSLTALSNYYLDFLNKFKTAISGTELGSGSFRFMKYIQAMGLEGIVVPESGKLIFNSDTLTPEAIKEIPDDILKLVKTYSRATDTLDKFVPVLAHTFRIIRSQSEKEANEWITQILRNHGSFLMRTNVIAALRDNIELELPEIFEKVNPGSIHLYIEEKPDQAYRELKQIINYGLSCLCISKLPLERMEEIYKVRPVSMLWVTSEKSEQAIDYRDINGLTEFVSEFANKHQGSVILLDCFDQIKLANGFSQSMSDLKDLIVICKRTNSILLLSVNPAPFGKQQLATVNEMIDRMKGNAIDENSLIRS